MNPSARASALRAARVHTITGPRQYRRLGISTENLLQYNTPIDAKESGDLLIVATLTMKGFS